MRTQKSHLSAFLHLSSFCVFLLPPLSQGCCCHFHSFWELFWCRCCVSAVEVSTSYLPSPLMSNGDLVQDFLALGQRTSIFCEIVGLETFLAYGRRSSVCVIADGPSYRRRNLKLRKKFYGRTSSVRRNFLIRKNFFRNSLMEELLP